MPDSRLLLLTIAVPLIAAGCNDGPTPPNGAIAVGESFAVRGARSVTLKPGATDGQYVAVVVNTGSTGGAESFSLRGKGISMTPPIGALLSANAPSALRVDAPAVPALDRAFESRLRDRERNDLTPRWAAARASMVRPAEGTSAFTSTSRNAVLPATVRVGDMVTVNVNGIESCSNPIYHRARVAAIGTHSVVLADSLNPTGGFTDADYARYAARFDTLVYPLDVGTFGEPSDIDGNGRIGLIFTLEVNRLTPTGSPTFIAGFTFSRDLFPVKATSRLDSCAGSNEGEFFYLLTPDPFGRVNGNRRTAGFVDTNTTAVIAHEFEHLISASRRLYVSNAPRLEVKWLDEGLAHVAEELLFYHEAGLAPRQNVDSTTVKASPQRATAFNLDMTGGGNTIRYSSYLRKPSSSSPYASDDSLTTRGATWNLLRYLADHAASTDGDVFRRLASGPATGLENLQSVFGADTPTQVRNWATSQAVDDVVSSDAVLQQPSWNWHSMFTSLYQAYPLQIPTLVDAATASGSVVPGGAAYFRFGVAGDSSATLTLGASQTSGSPVQLVVVRTR